VDAFTGATLQMDGDGNSSTVTLAAWPDSAERQYGTLIARATAFDACVLDLKPATNPLERGRKLVVQTLRRSPKAAFRFRRTLDAVEVERKPACRSRRS